MLERIIFQSLAHADRAYTAYHSSTALWDSYYRAQQNFIGGWAGQFDTYGDGLCQHSNEFPVLFTDMGDYLASLATYLTEHPAVVPTLATHFRTGISLRILRFAAGLMWREGKQQYYSMSEQKVTTAAAKQYDKRWTVVDEGLDGSADALFRITAHDCWSNLERYAYATWLVAQADEETIDTYLPHNFPAQRLGLDKGQIDTAALRQAYHACLNLVCAQDHLDTARQHLEAYHTAEPAEVTA